MFDRLRAMYTENTATSTTVEPEYKAELFTVNAVKGYNPSSEITNYHRITDETQPDNA